MRRLAVLPVPKCIKRPVRRTIEGWRYVTAPWRVLPDFVCIGAQKGGTSALYRYLAGHPRIAPSWWNETVFFGKRFGKGELWYRSHFPLEFVKRMKVQTGGSAYMAGEASPDYMCHPAAPKRMHALIPEVRLIALLRNPVDRAISHYYHEVRKGHEHLSLEEALNREQERLHADNERRRRDPEYYGYAHQHYTYATRGIYVDHLQRWHAYFRREQLLIVKSETFFGRTGDVYKEILDFLGVPHWLPRHFAPHNVGTYPEAEQGVRERLQAFFEPHNRRLYEYLGVDWRWEQ